MADSRLVIAKNIANMLNDGDFVNLGIGIPTLVSGFIPPEKTVLLHGENGAVGQDKIICNDRAMDPDEKFAFDFKNGGERGDWKTGHRDLINAGCDCISLIPGGSCFDSSISFAMARGGHLDATVLGGLQVDVNGNLANWIVPGRRLNGMGGAMDLVSGAKKVIIAMEHCSKDGESKLVNECTMPLTAIKCVSTIVTELCIIDCEDGKFIVRAIAPGVSREELQSRTEAPLYYADCVVEMEVPD